MVFRFFVRVYIEDTDMGGVVFYANYLKFMERARTELLRAQGVEQRLLQQQGVLFVVHSLDMRYLKPAKLDDPLVVETTISRLKGASIVFSQRVLRGAEALCEGRVRVACVEASNLRPKSVDSALSAVLQPYLSDEMITKRITT